MSSLDDAIAAGVKSGIKAAANTIPDIVLNALWDHPWYPFIVGGQARLIEAGLKPREAWELARKVLTDFVKSERTEFGSPGFDWGPQGGRAVLEESEIAYWDQQS